VPAVHRARKRFGQHFLTDLSVIDGIVRAIAPGPSDILVEIGPGLGALTEPLLALAGHLTVIELDRDLAARLQRRAGLTVIAADALQVDFTALRQTAGGLLRVVGNLPYNISTPLLFHLLAHAPAIKDQHFMLQKEVVDRMVAAPSTAAYGRLSVMLQWRYDMESLLKVPPSSFDPPPRVDSAVVRMIPRPTIDARAQPLLEDLVRVAFSQRRKLMRQTLGRWLDDRGYSGGFDVHRRAEEVSVAEYVTLVHELT
jgi:16S rRNA (adenine1518-N6/adenine1519-N6)-dimethyltransferase